MQESKSRLKELVANSIRHHRHLDAGTGLHPGERLQKSMRMRGMAATLVSTLSCPSGGPERGMNRGMGHAGIAIGIWHARFAGDRLGHQRDGARVLAAAGRGR